MYDCIVSRIVIWLFTYYFSDLCLEMEEKNLKCVIHSERTSIVDRQLKSNSKLCYVHSCVVIHACRFVCKTNQWSFFSPCLKKIICNPLMQHRLFDCQQFDSLLRSEDKHELLMSVPNLASDEAFVYA